MGNTKLTQLWNSIAFCILLLVMQVLCNENFNCPTECTCKTQNLASNVHCTSLFSEKEAIKSPVTHFSIVNATSQLTLTENIFAKLGLSHVKSIYISGCTIIHIDKQAFKGLTELNSVRIEHSNLSNIHPNIFVHNNDLKKVKLFDTLLKTNDFLKSDSIEELVLSQCNITQIAPNSFSEMNNLILVDLSNNEIKSLPPTVFRALDAVQEIRLSNNNITEVPHNLFETNFDLDELDLSKNPISKLPVMNIEILMSLNLRSCKLMYIDTLMFSKLLNLENLDISNNRIIHIEPKAFSYLNKLTYINLSGNKLKMIHENIFLGNSVLQKINLNNNPLTSLPMNGFKNNVEFVDLYYFSCRNCDLRSLTAKTFQNMPKLVMLYLSNNKISDVSMGVFKNLKNLIELDLSRNQLSTVDDQTFVHNHKLTTLSLAHNPLKALHASMFAVNVNLKCLDLSHCGLFKLWTLSAVPENLASVETLNISHNKIDFIGERDIRVTSNLKSLDISDNPLLCTQELKNLTVYLDKTDVKKSPVKENDQIVENMNSEDKEKFNWNGFFKEHCPSFISAVENINDANDDDDDDDDDDDYIEDYYGDKEQKNGNTDYEYNISKDVTGKQFRDSIHLLSEPGYFDDEGALPTEQVAGSVVHHHGRYSIMWPVLVFTGTALLVLGVVAKCMLFVINRRHAVPVTRFIRFPATSKLSKNSNLVYQQLSEEKDPVSTPVLSRFTLIPSVHVGQNKQVPN